MYEAIVLKKKSPQVSKTPFLKLNLCYKFVMVFTSTSLIYSLLNYMDRKKLLLMELDEFNICNAKLNVVEEYRLMQGYWGHTVLRGIAIDVLERYAKEGKLGESSHTVQEFREGTRIKPVD